MTVEERVEFEENQKKIEELLERQKQLNPYYNLKLMSNKEFGEQWSESYILSQCSNLQKDNSRGHDFYNKNFGRIEVKSSRLPNKGVTYNQCHPYECEYFLFVNYNTIDGSEQIYFVPSEKILDSDLFSITKQHSRDEGTCYSMSGSTKKNKTSLGEFSFENFFVLNNYLGSDNNKQN